jgi:hypothetical protein
MKKKLQLHRMTIANLTAPALRRVVGGDGVAGGGGGGTDGAGVHSREVDTVERPCQLGTGDCVSGFLCGTIAAP